MLNLRAATPELLIDIARLTELKRIESDREAIMIGAGVRHADFEDGRVPDVLDGLLARVARGIAYRAVRNRGTIGGSLAHADPAADWPSIMIALGATIHVRSAKGARTIAAADLVTGALTTSLAPDELIEAIRIPRYDRAARAGYPQDLPQTGRFCRSSRRRGRRPGAQRGARGAVRQRSASDAHARYGACHVRRGPRARPISHQAGGTRGLPDKRPCRDAVAL